MPLDDVLIALAIVVVLVILAWVTYRALRAIFAARRARSGQPPEGWVPANLSPTISGLRIGGMVYYGAPPEGASATAGYWIDPSLPLDPENTDLAGDGLGDHPRYGELTPTARATYLRWLASGRNDERFNLGYMRLYLHGLERRFFRDISTWAERETILEEVIRLRERFGPASERDRLDLDRFVDAGRIVQFRADLVEPPLEPVGDELPLALRVPVAAMLIQGMPLTQEWMFSWWSCAEGWRSRDTWTRCASEFRALFGARFTERFPNGLRVRVRWEPLAPVYRATSGEFEFPLELSSYGDPLPDITDLEKPLETAREIATGALSELSRLNRYLGRNPEGRTSVEAQALLPAGLRARRRSPQAGAFVAWTHARITEGGRTTPRDLLTRLEGARPDSVDRRRLTDALDTLAGLGFAFAPDPRVSPRLPELGEPVTLFALGSGATALEPPGEAYREAVELITLCVAIARWDGGITPAKTRKLREIAAGAEGLSDRERAYLDANLTWLRAASPDLAALRGLATPARMDTVRNLVGALVRADGAAGEAEAGRVERALSELERSRDQTEPEDPAGPVTARPDPDRPDRQEEARRAARRLAEAMNGARPRPAAQPVVETSPFPGLDPVVARFATELLRRSDWSALEFEALARRHRLTPGGVLETLNAWSGQRFGEAMLEEGDGYRLSARVTAQLTGDAPGTPPRRIGGRHASAN